jgi:RNA polymerase sigma-70 factor (ECF subfamily)
VNRQNLVEAPEDRIPDLPAAGASGGRDARVRAVDPDMALLERWRAGERRAGSELYDRYFKELYRFLDRKVPGASADLTQACFEACTRSRDQVRGQSSFRTYLFSIAKNELYSYLRRLPRGEHIDFDQVSIAEMVTSATGRLARAQAVDRLRGALAQLPAEQQLLLELHYWHDFDAAALGELFEAPAATIRVRLTRARQALRDLMGTDEDGL